MTIQINACTVAIKFALEDATGEGMAFLRCWLYGDFDVIRKEWPEAPESVYIGADPLHPETVTMFEHIEKLEQRDNLLHAAKRVCTALNNTSGMPGREWIVERKAAFDGLRDAVNEVEGR